MNPMAKPMRLRYPKTLITGKPGVGKTTLVQKIIDRMPLVNMAGFFTAEIRYEGSRLGFELQGLNGKRRTLAHVDIDTQYRVGKYGVDVESLDRVGVSALRKASGQCDLVVVDEIGKMELFSASFREVVLEIIGSRKRVLGTIMFHSNPWADAIKRQPQVNLVTVTTLNHRQVLEELLHWLKATD